METNQNNQTNDLQNIKIQPVKNEENLNEAKQELQNLNNGLNDQSGFVVQKRDMLLRHVEQLDNTNKTFLDKLLMKREDKELLKIYSEKKQEAVSIIMTNQNHAIQAVGETYVKFIQEVCRTLELTSGSSLKAGANIIYTENKAAMLDKLTVLNNQFLDRVEMELQNAATRPEYTRTFKMDQIELMCKEWQKDYHKLLQDFGTILA